MLYPEVASRDCGDCQKWQYDESTGKRYTSGNTKRLVPRHGPTPCRTHVGCPKGTPENQLNLTPENTQVYLHYLECRAVGEFPNDPIVRNNAALIRSVEDEFQQKQAAIRHRQIVNGISEVQRILRSGT